ncbi:membrane protein [Cellulomonas chitinilytica]|uniref:Membrane protein n=1 Tax=Cellulomonas chitinilytica TaxID=398759 RepID=A0A919P0S8_9CELL|nr:glycerophosphoryl diester phosphodiesterase membrane domain-containing protein [Cellulomonas chitinilytica]GIG20145.1 membrane protein [Cellulomonas chitinilytica]
MTSPHDDAPRPPAWVSPTGAPPAAPPPPTGPVPPSSWGQPVGPPVGQSGTGWGPAVPPPVAPSGGPWRPPALQPGIIPLRPLGLGEILDGAFRAVRANPRVMFGLAAAVVTVAVALQQVTRWYVQGLLTDSMNRLLQESDPTGELGMADQMGALVGSVVSLPFTQIATTVLTGLVILSVSRSVLGQSITIGQALRTSRVWWVLGFTVLAGAAQLAVAAALAGGVVLLVSQDQVAAAVVVGLLGAVALFVALVWFAVRTLLVPPALMLEGKAFWRSVGRAWRLTRGSFWRLLGTYLLVSFIVGFVSNVIVFPVSMFTALVLQDPAGTSFASIVLVGIANVVALTLATTYLAAVVALLYIDVRMRREGLDIELARAAQADG